jgi:hypothetical protein
MGEAPHAPRVWRVGAVWALIWRSSAPRPRPPLVGRVSWRRRVRLASRKSRAGSWERSDLGTYFCRDSGLKLSGERDGGLGLARFSAVCPLGGHMGGHMYANGLLPFMVRIYGRCCMYGPNYVKCKIEQSFCLRLKGGGSRIAPRRTTSFCTSGCFCEHHMWVDKT